ncbi:hypothetical protein Nmel_006214 [Mimus melanotis]
MAADVQRTGYSVDTCLRRSEWCGTAVTPKCVRWQP